MAALLATPAALSAQDLDSLFVAAAERARLKATELAGSARPDGGARQYTEALTDLQAGRWSDAALSLQAAMQRNRTNPVYQGDLGYALARQAQWEEAADAFASASRIQAQNAWYMVGLAAVRAVQQRWADAAGTFQLAHSTDTAVLQAPRLAAVAGQAYEAAGDRARAAEWYQIAIARSPNDAETWLRLAILQRARNDTAGVTTIRRYMALRPNDRLGSAVYATWLSERGQIDSALALAALAAEDSAYRPYAAEVYLAAGVNLLRARDLARAVDVLNRGKPWASAELQPTYAFYVGSAEMQQLAVRLNDLQESQSCEGTRGLDTLVARVERNLRSGRAVDSTRADMFLTQILPSYQNNVVQMTQTFCDPARQRRQPARQPARRPGNRP